MLDGLTSTPENHFNMNRISLEAALIELEDMFPQYDKGMLEEVVRQHGSEFLEIMIV